MSLPRRSCARALLPVVPALVALITALITALTPAAAAPDVFSAGKPLFDKDCGGCHQIGLGAANAEGPKLNGIIGAPAGVTAGYEYSPATARSGVIWTEKSFLDFIADPRAAMPGTRMVVPGVTSEAERQAIYAYVSRFAADGSPRRP